MKKCNNRLFNNAIILIIVLMFSLINLSCSKKSTEQIEIPYGDLNLNGKPNEIADAVLFTHYFIYGDTVFGDNLELLLIASNVNRDGIYPDVADLNFMIRILVGDALPYPNLNPVFADVDIRNTISVDQDMSLALIVIKGNVTPYLLVDNMTLRYNYDTTNNVTRTLVYSFETYQTFNGEFINVKGEVESVSFATYEGRPVIIYEIPNIFAVDQNYPNPFIDSTIISFATPIAQEVTLRVENKHHDIIFNHTAFYQAGHNKITWPPSDLRVDFGYYYYSIITSDTTITMEMYKSIGK